MSFDDPNRQAIGLDPAWVEGTGGVAGDPTAAATTAGEQPATEQPDLDEMTKDELRAEADRRGIETNDSMTKAEIREALGA